MSIPITWKTTTLYEFLYELNYIPEGWEEFFEKNKKDIETISKELYKDVAKRKTIYPPLHQVFRCLTYFKPSGTKIVILGQDPYTNGSAVGLCFSVKKGNDINPSLKNIYKELKNEGYTPSEDGILIPWAKQGMMLLNTALTVLESSTNSHLELWSGFSKKLIEYISKNSKCVWMLFGDKAINYEKYVSSGEKNVLRCSHPSPLGATKASKASGRAFIGSGIFKECDEVCEKKFGKKIKW
jgi:uracil-DNA glycosylase